MGSVADLVPECKCGLLNLHGDADMIVFRVPGTIVRWSYAAIGGLPGFGGAIIVAALNGFFPAAVSKGSLSVVLHVGILILVSGCFLALTAYVANMRMNTRSEYVLGGLKNVLILFGVLNFLRELGAG